MKSIKSIFSKHNFTVAIAVLLLFTLLCAPLASAGVLDKQSMGVSVGSQVKIVRGATDYYGNELSRAHYFFDFTVKSMSGSRVSLTKTMTIDDVGLLGISLNSKVKSVLTSVGVTSYTVTLDVDEKDLYFADEPAPADTKTDFQSYKNIRVGSVVYIYDPVDYDGKAITPLYTFVDLNVTAISGDKVTVEKTIKLNELIEEFGVELPKALQTALQFVPSSYLTMDVKKEVKNSNLILVGGSGYVDPVDPNDTSYKKGTYTASSIVAGYRSIPSSAALSDRLLTIPAGGGVVVTEVKGRWGKTCINRTEVYVDLSKFTFITPDYLLISDSVKVGSTVNIKTDARLYNDISITAIDYLISEYSHLSSELCLTIPFVVEGDQKSYGDKVKLSYTDHSQSTPMYISLEVPVTDVEPCSGTYVAGSAMAKLYAQPDESSNITKIFTPNEKIVIDTVENGWGHTYINGMEGYIQISELTFQAAEKELFSEIFKVGDTVMLKPNAKTYLGASIIEELTAISGGVETITEGYLFQSEFKIIEGFSDYVTLYLVADNGMSYSFCTNINNIKLPNGVEVDIDVYGDIDRDGKLSMTDITEYQRAIASLTTLTDMGKLCSDVNGDGKNNLADVTLMQCKIAGLIVRFDVE